MQNNLKKVMNVYGGMKKPRRKVFKHNNAGSVARSTNFDQSKGFHTMDAGGY